MRRALGTEWANGYTTLKQSNELTALLGLNADSRLLDLGAGRCWPGVQMARLSGCQLVTTDLTVEASIAAKEPLKSARDVRSLGIVAASGTDLPFAIATFDAVIHADVLC